MIVPFAKRMRVVTLAVAMLAATGVPTLAHQGHSPIQATPADPSATPVAESVADWNVENVAVVDVEGAPVTMSPDGTLLAGIGADRELCIWDVDSFEPTCEQPSGLAINPDSIVWSPDGSALAYTLDAFRLGEESDLFVYELDTNESVNLTDDGVEGSLFGSEGDAPMYVDVMPVWHPDSQSITFARTEFTSENPDTRLMTVSRAGGEPELLETVANMPFSIFTRMYLLDDGTVLYALGPNDLDNPDTGIWVLAPGGETLQVMSAPADSGFPLPAITDVHQAGGTVMIAAYSYVGLSRFVTETPIAFVLELDTGVVVPLEFEQPGTLLGPTIFAPDGATTFSVLMGPDGDTLVAIVDGVHEVIELGSGDASEGGSVWVNTGIEWRGENTLFLPNALTRDSYIVTLAG